VRRIPRIEWARKAYDDVADPRLGKDLPVMNQYFQAERAFNESNVNPARSPDSIHKRRIVALGDQWSYQ
jgi:hypothetical protein